jgi:hypothetical protein
MSTEVKKKKERNGLIRGLNKGHVSFAPPPLSFVATLEKELAGYP